MIDGIMSLSSYWVPKCLADANKTNTSPVYFFMYANHVENFLSPDRPAIVNTSLVTRHAHRMLVRITNIFYWVNENSVISSRTHKERKLAGEDPQLCQLRWTHT